MATSPKAVKKWQAAHIKRYGFPVSLDNDRDIIAKLDTVENKSAYIKQLIRSDIKKSQEKQK